MLKIYVNFEDLKDFMQEVFLKIGVPTGEAEICADVLIQADKMGIDSHGINRLKPIYYDRIKAGIQFAETKFDIVREGPTTAVIDGNHGMGMVIAKKSMQMAIDKAKKYGMGMVAVRNSTHYGIAGYYSLMAEKAGMIGITGTNARPSIAPTFGVENMLGTNPLTFAIPTDEEFPLFLDCATSVTQRGKIEVYAREGKDCPEGWVIDKNGNTKSDSKQILVDLINGDAALTPLGGIGEDGGGYKGYGYATVVEILSAALQGGNFLKALSGIDENGNKRPYGLGHFFIVMDINGFTDLDDFKKISGSILRELRNSKKAPDSERIYTPGEKEYLCYQKRKKEGVPINEALQNEIKFLKQELKIDKLNF